MFFKKESTKENYIYAPADGVCITLSQVPDPVFSEKMLGDGIAILPNSGKIASPVSGTLSEVTSTKHAYGITTDDGLEILVHIGIDTVNLAGEGFETTLKKGDKVKMGDTLATVDLELLKEKGYDLHTPVIITNMGSIKNMKLAEGNIKSREVLITYKMY